VPETSLSDAITQLESEKILLSTARVRLDAAYTTYLEATRYAQLAKIMLQEDSEAMARVQSAVAQRRDAALPVRPAHVWDESLSVAEKVSIVGLETARTLACGTCACWNPECTLPRKVKEYLKSRNML
jgi:hypothetical protein